ncbi:hypothetical protein JYU34_007605 [Plutella xylostella]|uniref:Uncharacterized protein n=1 Tax=Plutella xylostella TaxID=51655 RepID=A0ABQ7QR01_PLUXY|nr:hypothetical protein JYU34_007605 [Plutella xylostella]
MSLLRSKSPTRAEAIAIALRPAPVFSNGVLLGNWVEDRAECPPQGTFYFPKEVVDDKKLDVEKRLLDFRQNKLLNLQGNLHSIIKHDSHEFCNNFLTTNNLVYNHLNRPLCGPNYRYYRRSQHQYYPQPDNMECFSHQGYFTEWGLQKFIQSEWKCDNMSDYISTVYEDTYVPPKPQEYLQRCERKARTSSFTKSIRFKMTKSK